MPEIFEALIVGLVDEATENREQMCEEEIDSYEEYYGNCQSYTRESIHARAEGYAQENVGSIDNDDLKMIERVTTEQKASRDVEADEYDTDNDAEYELCINATNEGTTWWLRKSWDCM
jgi:hypothetical protein